MRAIAMVKETIYWKCGECGAEFDNENDAETCCLPKEDISESEE